MTSAPRHLFKTRLTRWLLHITVMVVLNTVTTGSARTVRLAYYPFLSLCTLNAQCVRCLLRPICWSSSTLSFPSLRSRPYLATKNACMLRSTLSYGESLELFESLEQFEQHSFVQQDCAARKKDIRCLSPRTLIFTSTKERTNTKILLFLFLPSSL